MLLLIIILSVLALVLVMIYFSVKGQQQLQAKLDEQFPNAATKLLLQKGSKGYEVVLLQKWLNANRSPEQRQIAVDGIFGARTEAILKELTKQSSIRLQDLIHL